MNPQTRQNIIDRFFDSYANSSNKEEAINKFLKPRRGRPVSNEVVIKTLVDFCHEKINSSDKKDWKEVVEVIIDIVKTIKSNSVQKQVQKQDQKQVLPQFGQGQIQEQVAMAQKAEKKANYRKEVDGSFTVIYGNGYTKTFTKKQMDFFIMISKEYNSL